MNTARATGWAQQLRDVHQRLRDALEVSREAVESGVPPERIERDLLIYCWGFCTALTGHHQSEDRTLFPLILEEHPELAPVVANLVSDHNMISQLIGDLRHSLQAPEPPDVLLRHLDGIDAVMETHFRYEERQLASVLEGLETPGLGSQQLFGPLG